MGTLRKLGWTFAEKLADRMRNYDRQRLALMFLEKARPAEEIHDYTCTLCGYAGRFESVIGSEAVRLSAQCPQCHSRERHRYLKLWMDDDPRVAHYGRFVHFAPEPVMTKALKPLCDTYQTADIEPGRADLVLNLEALDLPDQSLDGLMANHVLEHVDDSKALPELFRVLKPGASAILTFPVIQSWDTSYEPNGITTAKDRHKHFGQNDHVRYFGRDVEARIRAAGFELDLKTANGADSATYALIPGDAIYVATRPT